MPLYGLATLRQRQLPALPTPLEASSHHAGEIVTVVCVVAQTSMKGEIFFFNVGAGRAGLGIASLM